MSIAALKPSVAPSKLQGLKCLRETSWAWSCWAQRERLCWVVEGERSCAVILGNMEQLMEEMGDHSGKGCTGKRAGFSALGSFKLRAAHVVRLLGKGTPAREPTLTGRFIT